MSIKSKMMKIGICSVMVLVPLSQVSFSGFAAEEASEKASEEVNQGIVNIPDANLKANLNQIIGQASTADITETQMKGFAALGLDNSVTDLTGIEYATNLTSLAISGSNITNATFPADMSMLTKLEMVEISNSSIDNNVYSRLNTIPGLTSLNLTNNSGITSLKGLIGPELTSLNVNGCQIDDFRGVETFPKLTSFHGVQSFDYTMDNTKETTIKSSELKFDLAKQTLFIPSTIFSTSYLTNFDGSKIGIDYSSPNAFVLEMGDSYNFTNDKVVLSSEGITLTGFTQTDYDNLNWMYFRTLFKPTTDIKPANLANGTYDIRNSLNVEMFNIDHSVNITAEENKSYIAGENITPEQFLTDIKAEANGATITSDFAEKVNMSQPGTYTVTLNAENTAGLKGEPIQVTVTVIEKTVITAQPEVTYELNEAKTEAEFLEAIQAVTNDGTAITSDFATAVDFSKAGTYTVTLNAENDNQKATPFPVKVTVNPKLPDPVVPVPDPIPDPTPDPEQEPGDEPVFSSDSSENPSEEIVDNEKVKEDKAETVSIQATTTNKVTLPKTGDNLPTSGVAVGFLVLGLGVMLARKK
ncbi:TPA: LapB repeat-containing protein [Listeria monocytogenes]|nr:LapB repeat-containing protein [Listeria monocytogenes]